MESARTLDHKGRITIPEMTDRELAEETLALLRAVGDALEGLGKNPMVAAMLPAGLLGK